MRQPVQPLPYYQNPATLSQDAQLNSPIPSLKFHNTKMSLFHSDLTEHIPLSL